MNLGLSAAIKATNIRSISRQQSTSFKPIVNNSNSKLKLGSGGPLSGEFMQMLLATKSRMGNEQQKIQVRPRLNS